MWEQDGENAGGGAGPWGACISWPRKGTAAEEEDELPEDAQANCKLCVATEFMGVQPLSSVSAQVSVTDSLGAEWHSNTSIWR